MVILLVCAYESVYDWESKIIFGGFRFRNLYDYVCMFVFYEMVQLCNVICAKIHAHVSVIIVNRREGPR